METKQEAIKKMIQKAVMNWDMPYSEEELVKAFDAGYEFAKQENKK